MTSEFDGANRRKFVRIYKNFILTYHPKDDPKAKFEITQLSNISRGGMCFLSSKYISPGMVLSIELKTPYITETIAFEGKIIDCREKVKNIIYEIRVTFSKLSPTATDVLHKLEQLNPKGED